MTPITADVQPKNPPSMSLISQQGLIGGLATLNNVMMQEPAADPATD
jgi:hypothetical protein